MCDELKTHTADGRGLCKSHAYQVKQAGGEVALELEPAGKNKPKTCEWPPFPKVQESEQPTEA